MGRLGALGFHRLEAADHYGAAARPSTSSPVSVCAASGLRPGPRCQHLVEERLVPGTLLGETCDAHDDRGDLVLPARYADWVAKTHPMGVARTFQVARACG